MAISAGQYHTCALLASGGLVCWGDNSQGQLGIGSLADQTLGSLTPVSLGSGGHSVQRARGEGGGGGDRWIPTRVLGARVRATWQTGNSR